MKKLIAIILCVVMAIGLFGCGVDKNTVQNERADNDRRMAVLYSDGFCIVYRDNETGVQYIVQPRGGMAAMLNPDGTPYTGNSGKYGQEN